MHVQCSVIRPLRRVHHLHIIGLKFAGWPRRDVKLDHIPLNELLTSRLLDRCVVDENLSTLILQESKAFCVVEPNDRTGVL